MVTKTIFTVTKVFADQSGVALSLTGANNDNLHINFSPRYGIPKPGDTITALVDDNESIVWANMPNIAYVAPSQAFVTPFKQLLQGNGRRSDAREIRQALRILKVTTNPQIIIACIDFFNQKERKLFSGIKSKGPYRLALALIKQHGDKQ